MTVIDVRRAELHTAAVTIETMRVDGRQVTLSTFRQLQSEPVGGPMWGWVNYHPDRCADDLEHRHVVWQMGETLLRATIYRPQQRLLDSYLRYRVFVAYLLDGYRWRKMQERYERAWLDVTPEFRIDSDFRFPRYESALWQLNQGGYLSSDQVAAIRTTFGIPAVGGRDALASEAIEAEAKRRSDHDTQTRTWEVVTELPQLFIAP